MTIQEIAQRLVELCREGKYDVAQQELYADDATSTEPAGAPGLQSVSGKTAIIEKGHQFQAMVESVQSSVVEDAIIAGNYFSVAATLHATLKGMGPVTMAEICVYRVVDGKIVSEQFFYDVK